MLEAASHRPEEVVRLRPRPLRRGRLALTPRGPSPMAQLSQRYAVERPRRLRCGAPCRDNHRHGLAHHHAMACANVVTRADYRPRTPPRDMAASISRWATLVRLRYLVARAVNRPKSPANDGPRRGSREAVPA